MYKTILRVSYGCPLGRLFLGELEETYGEKEMERLDLELLKMFGL